VLAGEIEVADGLAHRCSWPGSTDSRKVASTTLHLAPEAREEVAALVAEDAEGAERGALVGRDEELVWSRALSALCSHQQ